jgi:hypothetical protein
MPSSHHHHRDADGRLRGLAKVETWTKRANGRKGARLSPWRFGAVRYSPRPTPSTTRKP